MMHGLIVFSAAYLYLIILVLGGIIFVRAGRQDKIALVYLALVALPLAFLLGELCNRIIISPRPFLVDHVQALVPATADNGFPSDHTLLSMTVAFLVFAYNRKLGLLLIVLAAFVGAGRVLANVHHPIDVIGGTIIAAIAVFIASQVAPWLRARVPRRPSSLWRRY
jgi:undecaprenyl-diphosphatase